MIYTVTLSPAVDRTLIVPGLAVDKVNRATASRADAGGKGINVSKWIRALGGESLALGVIAGETGAWLNRQLLSEGIRTDFVTGDGETRTNIKLIDPTSGMQTDINEQGAPVRPKTLTAVLAKLTAVVRAGDIVVLAGKSPPETPESLLPDWINLFAQTGAKVFLDTSGNALRTGAAAGPYLIKPNELELVDLIGRTPGGIADIVEACQPLLRERTRLVVVSLGANGALFLSPVRAIHAHGLKVTIGSTTGAGDAMVAALALSEAESRPLDSAARLATAAGAASAMQSGAQVAERKLVEQMARDVVLEEI